MRLATSARPVVLVALLCLLALPATALPPSDTDAGPAHGAAAAADAALAAAPGWLDDAERGIVGIWEAVIKIITGGGPPGGKTPGQEIDPNGHEVN